MERLERAISREKEQMSPCVREICRRFLADEEDFSEERLQTAGIETRILNRDFDAAAASIEKLISDNTHIGLD